MVYKRIESISGKIILACLVFLFLGVLVTLLRYWIAGNSYVDAVEYYENGNTDKAYKLALISVELRPSNADAWNLLGHINYSLGKHKEAEENLIRSIELNPKNVQFIFDLGFIYLQNKNKEAAYKEFKKTLEINPNHLDSLRFLAILDSDYNNFTEARYYAQKILDKHPKDKMANMIINKCRKAN